MLNTVALEPACIRFSQTFSVGIVSSQTGIFDV